jgi:hypothetical protein
MRRSWEGTIHRSRLTATKESKPFIINANAGYLPNKNTLDEREDLWHLSLAAKFLPGKT